MKTQVLKAAAAITLALPAISEASPTWSNFIWYKQQIGSFRTDEAAILFPVKIDGDECIMQLDTGAGGSVLYRNALPARYEAGLNGERLSIEQFTLGERSWKRDFRLLYARTDGGGPHDCSESKGKVPLGTLGDDNFSDGSLTLDLARARYTYQSGPYTATAGEVYDMELLRDTEGPGTVAPLVSVTLPDGSKVKMMVDTGSAVFDFLIYSKETWLKLVGPDHAKHESSATGPRWGQSVTCHNAPVTANVKLGARNFHQGEIATWCDDKRGDLVEQFGVVGIIGLAPFHHKTITFDYVSGKFIVEPGGKSSAAVGKAAGATHRK